MIPLQKDLMFDTNFDAKNCFFYICNNNYILIDNLDNKELIFQYEKPFYNSSFYHAYIVDSGCLRLNIDGIEVNVRENEYLNIRPCTTVTFLPSQAKVFAFIIRAHAVLNIYQKTNLSDIDRKWLFCFYHHRFSKELKNEFLHIYKLMKQEAIEPDYKLKELVYNEYTKIYIQNVIANVDNYPEIEYYENNNRRTIYQKFLNLLHENYHKDRNVISYADKLHISSKYLSNITKLYTGSPASVVIDNYVAFRIKVMLYDGEMNIKKISETLNFHSQSFFGRYFKRMTGLAPREFIQNFNKRLYQTSKK